MTNFELEDARKRNAEIIEMERQKQATLFNLMQQIMAAQLELDIARNRLSDLMATYRLTEGARYPSDPNPRAHVNPAAPDSMLGCRLRGLHAVKALRHRSWLVAVAL